MPPDLSSEQVTGLIHAGLAHHRSMRYPEAEKCYMTALSVRPDDPGLLHLIGALAGDVGRPDAAIPFLQRAVGLNPEVSDYHSNLGEQYRRVGRIPEAIAELSRAVELKPDCFPSLTNLGRAEGATGNFASAVNRFRAALAVDPKHGGVRLLLGQALIKAEKAGEAAAMYRELAEADPANLDAWAGLALAHRRLKNSAEAVSASTRAVELKPMVAGFWADHSLYLLEAGRLGEALAAADRAVALEPTESEFHRQRAMVLDQLARLDECITELRTGLRLQSDNAEVRLDLANALLLRGEWDEAWGHYEWRWKSTRFPRRTVDLPQWDGSPLQGRSVLVHAEQGFGDMIQFVRYLPEIARRGGTGVLVVDGILFDLVDGLFGVPAKRPNEVQHGFDLHLPLASFPSICRTTSATIPKNAPYLSADPKRVETWKARLGPRNDRLRIGIAWGGRPSHFNDRNRSIRLEKFAPLAGARDAEWFSLQKGPPAEQARSSPPGLGLIDHTNFIESFADTAALLTQLDLVIAIDTSIIHLAGAMGIPAWVLLPYVPDWRWGLRGDRSDWYPSVRLFRPLGIGEWGLVFSDVSAALADFKPELVADGGRIPVAVIPE